MEDKNSQETKGMLGTDKAADSPMPPESKKSMKTKGAVKLLLEKPVQMYRAKMPLAKGQKIIPKGTLTDLGWLDEAGVQRLINMGAVRAVVSPPLAELAGWQTRSRRLAPVGVITMADFLIVPAADLASVLRAKPATVIGWQEQLRAWSKSEEAPRH